MVLLPRRIFFFFSVLLSLLLPGRRRRTDTAQGASVARPFDKPDPGLFSFPTPPLTQPRGRNKEHRQTDITLRLYMHVCAADGGLYACTREGGREEGHDHLCVCERAAAMPTLPWDDVQHNQRKQGKPAERNILDTSDTKVCGKFPPTRGKKETVERENQRRR